MKRKVVLAGGGHAHMVPLAKLETFVEKGWDVTVIGPSEHHYYSGMGPGMLGQTYTPAEIRFATRRVVENKGGTFKLGKVTAIDAPARTVQLDSGEAVPYDVLSCNLGSHVPLDIVQGELNDVYLVKPIERLLEAQTRILQLAPQKKLVIGIVGGGPSAVEIAGNVWRLTQAPDMEPADIRILTSSGLMPHHPPGVRRRALGSLKKRGVQILDNCKVSGIRTGRVDEISGRSHGMDIIFVAVGVRPNRVFKESGLPVGPDGGLSVNRYLQCTAHPNIFGGGDCIYFEPSPLDKVGVYAVRQNPVLFHNLAAFLEGEPLQPFTPGGKYLLIFNLGDGTGIFHKWGIQFSGRLAFDLKDWIDRRFMERFQQIES